MYKIFSISEAISFSYQSAIKNNYILFFAAIILYAVLIVMENLFSHYVYPLIYIELNINGRLFMILFNMIFNWILFMFPSVAITLGLAKVTLRVCDNESTSAGQLFEYFKEVKLVFKVMAGHILTIIMVIIGTCLLIVPGIIVALMFSQFNFCMIEHRLSVIEGLKMSKNLTSIKGVKPQLFFLYLTFFGIMLISFIPCGLGFFVSFPMAWMAYAFVYRTLAPMRKPEGEYNTNEIVVSPGI